MDTFHPLYQYTRPRYRYFIALFLVIIQGPAFGQQTTLNEGLRITKGWLTFVSDAPQERITATTDRITGVLDLSGRTFAIIIPVRSFNGFNSPLQQEHFNENYLESDEFPDISFEGRIIEQLDGVQDTVQQVRAKGMLYVHGVMRERIIDCEVREHAGVMNVTSQFMVALKDHDISVPRVVQQKVAPDIRIDVDLTFRTTTEE